MLIEKNFKKTIVVLSSCVVLAGCWGSKSGKKANATASNIQSDVLLQEKEGLLYANEASSQNSVAEETVCYFDLNSDLLSSRAKNTLNSIADYLRKHSDTILVVEGHADIQGGASTFNEVLSESRAYSVKSYLNQQGIGSEQMDIKWYSNRNLVDLDNTEVAHAKNRRVELQYR